MSHAIADTSRLALRGLRAAGKIGPQQQRVLDALARSLSPLTRNEIAEAAGLRVASACGRVAELIECGAIQELPRRPCSITGESAHELRIVPAQGSLFQAQCTAQAGMELAA